MDLDHRSEDIELPNFDEKQNENDNRGEYDDDNPERKKKRIIVAIFVVVGVVVLGVIIFLVIYFSSKKKENGGAIKIIHVLNEKSLDSKREFSIFNVGNLKKDDYTIEYNIDDHATIATSKRILVNDFTVTDDGKFIFNNNKIIFGKIEFTINFKTVLTRMDEMFKNLKSLYSVDLSGIKSEDIKYMNNMFTNCENLNTVNFKNFNSKKVETMESVFENCINLIELDLSSFKTPKLKKLTKAFKNCTNLVYLNLANFELNSNIVDREDIFTDVKNLEQLIINNENTQTLLYTAGNITIDNTQTCPEECYCNNNKCTACHEGYYFYSNMASKCLKCPEECQICTNIFECMTCSNGYIKSLNNNNCIPEGLNIEGDTYGEEEEQGYKIET